MMQHIGETSALRMQIRHLSHAIETTTCRETVGVLRQALREAEAKLRMSELSPDPAKPKTI